MAGKFNIDMDDSEILMAGKFLAAFIVIFAALSLLFSLLPLQGIELFFAAPTLEILKLFGFNGTINAGAEPVLILLQNLAVPISISYLCTGLMEVAIISAAVLSSFGISIRKRIFGVVAAIAAIALFNLFRIVASILIILWFGLDAGNFSHDLLFRIFLFATIAGFYFVWFGWATDAKKQN